MSHPMPGPPQWYEHAGLGDWDDKDRWCNRWDLHWEDGRDEFDVLERHDKRMTDAECAAEFWRAYRDNEWGGHTLPDGYGPPNYYPPAPGRPTRWVLDPDMLEDCLNTWRRFAATPHALDIDGAAS